MGQILASLTGFSAGFIVAGGIVAMMAGLGVITRFIGITKTAAHAMIYEDSILLGAIAGTILTVFHVSLPPGSVTMLLLILFGGFTGMFVGGWIMALAEIANVFPVYCRRFGIAKSEKMIVVTLAAGKVIGSLVHFFMRWGIG